MKLNNKNILIILVFCFLGLMLAFSFQHGFSSSLYRELATDSGFDSDFGGGSSGGGGSSSSSSSSDFGGSSGGGSGGADPFSLTVGLIITIVVVYPVLLHFNENKHPFYLIIISLLIGYVMSSLFSLPLILAIILFGALISNFPVFVSIPIVIFAFVLALYGLICLRKVIIKAIALKKLNDKENGFDEISNYDCFSSVIDNPIIIKEAYDIYVKIQEAWSRNDIEDVRNLLSSEIYNMYSSQIKTMIKKNQRNEMADFKFIKGAIVDFQDTNEQEKYVITLRVTCRDYLVNNKTNEVIRGSSSRINDYTYSLTFIRNKSLDLDKCPNCNAELPSFGESIKCSYCGSIIERKSTSLVLINKKMLRQR